MNVAFLMGMEVAAGLLVALTLSQTDSEKDWIWGSAGVFVTLLTAQKYVPTTGWSVAVLGWIAFFVGYRLGRVILEWAVHRVVEGDHLWRIRDRFSQMRVHAQQSVFAADHCKNEILEQDLAWLDDYIQTNSTGMPELDQLIREYVDLTRRVVKLSLEGRANGSRRKWQALGRLLDAAMGEWLQVQYELLRTEVGVNPLRVLGRMLKEVKAHV